MKIFSDLEEKALAKNSDAKYSELLFFYDLIGSICYLFILRIRVALCSCPTLVLEAGNPIFFNVVLSTMKFAFVFSSEESSWVSCQVITPNLFAAYKKEFSGEEFRSFHYGECTNKYEYRKIIDQIVEYAPDKIIFLDHKPHPGEMIKDLYKKYQGESLPSLYIHIFGDFSLYTKQWHGLESYLKKFPVKFIAASHRQQRFFDQFVDEDCFSDYCHFPVDESLYRFDSNIRERARKDLGLEKYDKVFLYTGRLSAQKNISQLLNCFNQYLSLTNKNDAIVIAGAFDNIGYPFFGQYYPEGFNFYSFIDLIENLDENIKERVIYAGNLSSNQLLNYYNASDIFISLSLHNDEDYGMSPAEAITCGMPSILSDWGGYASFKMKESPIELATVEQEDGYFKVKSSAVIKQMMIFGTKKITYSEREELEKKAKESFSISSAANKLKAIHEKPIFKFKAWNKRFQAFNLCFEFNQGNPFGVISSETQEKDGQVMNKILTKEIYRECYNEYVNKL